MALSKHPELRGHSEAFFLRHGSKSVFLARFIGPLRAGGGPTTAGMMAMLHRKFQTFNVLSAVIWAPLLMSPGHLAWTCYDLSGVGGRATPAADGNAGQDAAKSCAPTPPVEGAGKDRLLAFIFWLRDYARVRDRAALRGCPTSAGLNSVSGDIPICPLGDTSAAPSAIVTAAWASGCPGSP